MTNKCQPFRELLPCYALEALDPDEARSLEKHLRTCADCRVELEKYRTIARACCTHFRALLRLKVSARLDCAFGRGETSAGPRRIPRWQNIGAMGDGAGVGRADCPERLNDDTTQTMRQQQAALATQLTVSQKAMSLATYHESHTYELSGAAAGTVVLNDELHSGALFMWGLAPLDAAHIYQIWLVQKDGKRVSGGLFKPEPGQPFVSALISIPQPLPNFVALGVTVEPSGGSPGPTTPKVFGATF